MFTSHISGCEFENYNRENIRSWAIALGNCLHRSDVWEFTRRLIGEPPDSPQPQITEWTFWQLACWCQTDGAYGQGMEYAQKISMAVFGQIIQRRDNAA